MDRWRKMAKDTALLTGSSLFMRCIGMAFQVWLVGRIGASGIGLYQLVASVNFLCATFAVSGIRFTTTRLVSEERGAGRDGGIGAAIRRCLGYALFFGLSASAVLFTGAEPIGFLWIGDARTVLSLRIIAFRMPFIAVSSVLNGYFIASGKSWKSACVQIAEQLVTIALVMLLLLKNPGCGLERSCACVSLGGTLGDAVSMLLVLTLFLRDRRRAAAPGSGRGLTLRLLHIAVPLALSAYARTSLNTLEELLVPRELRSSGLTADAALAGYGTITGMVFPIIGFPSCLLSALAEIVIPDLTVAQVTGDREYISRTVSALMRASLVFSLAAAAFLFSTADALGALIYGDASVGGYIRVFSLILPVMYLDIVTDGCLKGLGQMMYSMCFNIAEALIGVLLVVFVLPRFALRGYVFVIFFREIFNFLLSFGRLRRVTGFSFIKKPGRTPAKPAPSRGHFEYVSGGSRSLR